MNALNLGFVGAGNMAQAIIKGALEKKILNTGKIYIYDIDTTKLNELSKELGVNTASSINELCEKSDILLLAVKPNVMEAVLKDIKTAGAFLPVISIAAGWSAKKIKDIAGKNSRVLRLMPNTPLMAGQGMSVFESPCNLSAHEIEFAENLFSAIGKVEYAPLELMDAVTAISGSGPAYFFMFIEALADAGAKLGLSKQQSLTLAAQTALGAAKMVIDTNIGPGALKDAVCSPGGTTIEAVKSFEENGLHEIVGQAVEKCAAKSKYLSEKS